VALQGRRDLIRDLALVPALLVAAIVGTIANPHFLTTTNFLNILQQSGQLAVLVLAESLVIIAGRFDLSLESTFGLAPMIGGYLVVGTAENGSGFALNPALAIGAIFAVGAAIGAVNGLLIVKLRLNAFIVTLGMLILLRGITVGLVGGQTLYQLPRAFTYLGSSTQLGIPTNVWVAAVLYLVVGLGCRYHRTGRAIYAIGGSEEAARAAGIRTNKVLTGLYIFGGLMAALAGLMEVGRFGAVPSTLGQNEIFTVFAAAVIGGISLKGGRGSVLGALCGVLLLNMISNILVLAQVSQFWIDASYGAIILIALVVARLFGAEQD
jgi:simple sugar transport system permease protein